MAVLNSYGPAIDVLAAGAIAIVTAGSELKVQIDPTS